YHYEGICMKKNSLFYARYCSLLGAKTYHSGDVVAFEKSTNYNSIIQEEKTCENHSPVKTDPVGSPLSEFRRCPFWEQELAKKYSCKTMTLLADGYCNYCQDILQNVRNQELERTHEQVTLELALTAWTACRWEELPAESHRQVLGQGCGASEELSLQKSPKGRSPYELVSQIGSVTVWKVNVENLLTSFWKSLQQDTVMLMSLPDVGQLFKCYDAQLYKGIEDILLHDFLEDVSVQYLISVRLFSKKFKLCLLNALEGFPALFQISKRKEVTVFDKRLRRKTYLCNMAKTVRVVLKNDSHVHILKSNLCAIISQGTSDGSEKAVARDPRGADDLETDTEKQCLSSLIALLGTSTDLSVFLNCLSSNLQAYVFQPSRSKEEFIKLAASFQLRWNFLLTAVSRAMTLCHRDSFVSLVTALGAHVRECLLVPSTSHFPCPHPSPGNAATHAAAGERCCIPISSSWHLFHLLLLEYVIHILQSCIEEEEEDDTESHKEMLPDDQSLVQPDQTLSHPPDALPAQGHESPGVDPHQGTLKPTGQDQSPVGVGSVVLRVLGFLVDTATGNKLIQVLLEDEATESTVKLILPMEQETLVTLGDGQKFVIHISDVPQSSENIHFGESNAKM
ncbi:hypothetical protein MC885_000417, partial [Smutsia gigantea]